MPKMPYNSPYPKRGVRVKKGGSYNVHTGTIKHPRRGSGGSGGKPPKWGCAIVAFAILGSAVLAVGAVGCLAYRLVN